MSDDYRHRVPREHLGSVARWIHIVLAAVGITLGFHHADTAGASALLVLGSIAYVSWTARRAIGLGVALIAGIVRFLPRESVATHETAVLAGLWLLLYMAVALIVSAIEAATRPEH